MSIYNLEYIEEFNLFHPRNKKENGKQTPEDNKNIDIKDLQKSMLSRNKTMMDRYKENQKKATDREDEARKEREQIMRNMFTIRESEFEDFNWLDENDDLNSWPTAGENTASWNNSNNSPSEWNTSEIDDLDFDVSSDDFNGDEEENKVYDAMKKIDYSDSDTDDLLTRYSSASKEFDNGDLEDKISKSMELYTKSTGDKKIDPYERKVIDRTSDMAISAMRGNMDAMKNELSNRGIDADAIYKKKMERNESDKEMSKYFGLECGI